MAVSLRVSSNPGNNERVNVAKVISQDTFLEASFLSMDSSVKNSCDFYKNFFKVNSFSWKIRSNPEIV
jgi:hypothetical protein